MPSPCAFLFICFLFLLFFITYCSPFLFFSSFYLYLIIQGLRFSSCLMLLFFDFYLILSQYLFILHRFTSYFYMIFLSKSYIFGYLSLSVSLCVCLSLSSFPLSLSSIPYPALPWMHTYNFARREREKILRFAYDLQHLYAAYWI